ncbi:MAG: secondary thiamine-phosphate synthase enzyme YjbQ [bacterium]|nr:secondary thiamine-phosphate synthase enzyme YjbQ [bacterium]
MTIINEKFNINTEGNTDIIDITKHVQNCVYKHELRDAFVCVSVQSSTSAITTIEYENGLIQDLQEALEILAPTGKEYHHDEIWHDGNGYAHVRSALVGTSVCISLIDGILSLGTWQQIILLDFDNKQRSRTINVQIIS